MKDQEGSGTDSAPLLETQYADCHHIERTGFSFSSSFSLSKTISFYLNHTSALLLLLFVII